LFRNILRDLKANSDKRHAVCVIPEDLETEAPLEKIFEKYSQGNRCGIFTITNFTIEDGVAALSVEDVAPLSGGGATLQYSVAGDMVTYTGTECIFMS